MPLSLTEEQVKGINVQFVSSDRLTWVYIEKPAQAEVDFLARHFPQFHPLNLDDVLSHIQRPKVDEYEDHLFLVLHFPVFHKEARITAPSEVDIFVGEDYMVTVHCSGDLKPLSSFFKACQTSDEMRRSYLEHSSGYLLYHVLDRLVNYCFPILGKITENIDEVEDLTLAQPTVATVRELSFIRRDLVSFRRVIRPQLAVAELLERGDYPLLRAEEEIYFGDIADHLRKICDGLDDAREVLDILYDTSNWLTSHRIQEIMRFLTIIMALLTPATVLASIYGMNIPLPGGVDKGSPLPLILLLLIMFGIAAGLLYFFRRRGWL